MASATSSRAYQMRNRLFLAFLAVIVTALVSNLLYEAFIIRDFEDYVSGTKEDKLYWVLASVEGSHSKKGWDARSLHESVHWAMMLGLDVRVLDGHGGQIIGSSEVMNMLSPSMRRKMEGIADMASARGEFEEYPLYWKGAQVGTLLARELGRPEGITRKEAMFKKRGREFLLISFLIAGGGALILSLLFALFLSRPLNQMKTAVESMASGDFSVRLPVRSDDEIGRLARSFNFMAEALQREDKVRRHLTSNVAHELRTPLSVMKANVEAMADGVVQDQKHGLENIRLEVERLIRLVEGIEDITKAEASFFSRRENAEINIGEFVSHLVSRTAPLAADKGLGLERSGDDAVTAVTDPEKLETILQNILTNAIRYTQRGRILVHYGKKDGMRFIEVSDTGSGIPPERQASIFERFSRGEGSTGLGLGLAIARELTEVIGGRIEVKSTAGEGSVFTVWLPEATHGGRT